MNAWINRWMGAEIYLIHAGHGLLYVIALAIVAWQVPWWALLAGSPLILFSAAFWLYEAKFVLPTANQLLRGKTDQPRERMTATATTRPRGNEAARRDGPSTHDQNDER